MEGGEEGEEELRTHPKTGMAGEILIVVYTPKKMTGNDDYDNECV